MSDILSLLASPSGLPKNGSSFKSFSDPLNRKILCWLSEVTPGLLAGAEPEAHQFLCHGLLKG
jgi:hypothetical protein